ncbi:trypsin-like peptidase domain-containing protein [Streptomyces sp. NPDC096351]|uniref:nSTAND1 domain-containing NTPase n=1 Tax=Streptomyces sp. NPDC096351 TaxID=3366087 RepID=UPI003823B189
MTTRGTAAGHSAHGPAMAASVVRIRGGAGVIVGAGFLVAGDTVLTCAHVVSDALGQSRESAVETGAAVALDLPFAAGNPSGTAKVVHWVPVRDDQGGDVAVLRLQAPLPGAVPLPMADVGDVWDHATRAVGFTDDAPDGTWQQGRFRGPVGSSLVQLSRADGQAVHVRPGFSGSPVWDDALGVAVGMVVASQPVREAQQAFVMRTAALTDEVPGLADSLLPPKPFLGLQRFGEEAAHLFFGRDGEVDRVVAALRGDQPVITVCGPSGSGKSSLVLAGVVPELRASGWDILVVDCGRAGAPAASLATELFERAARGSGPARAEHADRVTQWLRELGLVDAFHRATGRRSDRLLVVLDQAEALLYLSEAELAETLSLLFPPRKASLKVLATLRADVLDTVLGHPGLAAALTTGVMLPLTPMTREQLHAVVTRPLESAPGVTYDPGLDQRILDDAGTDPGVLPLLGFLLEKLWERQTGGRLSAAVYQEIGGVRGALLDHAERVWKSSVPAGAELGARRLLAGLVRTVPGGGSVLRRSLARSEAGEERWSLARSLAGENARLLVLHGGDGRPESAELAHEALIAQWPQLVEVVRDDADFLDARAEIQHDLDRWKRSGHRRDLLPGGAQLDALTRRLGARVRELNAEQREFLTKGRGRQNVVRRWTRAGWIAGVLVVALIATLVGANVLESRLSAQRAKEAHSRVLAVQSDELMSTNPGHAALAAVAAYDTQPTQEARNALLRRFSEVRNLEWSLSGAEGTLQEAAMSADGRVALATTGGGRALLFVRTERGTVRQETIRVRSRVTSPQVSFDGRRISYVHADNGAIVWHDVTPSANRLAGAARPLVSTGSDASAAGGRADVSAGFKVTAFSRDARFLAEAPDETWALGLTDRPKPLVRVWDLQTGHQRVLPEKYSITAGVWFGPDDHTLVLESPVRSLIAVDIRSGAMRRLTEASDVTSERSDGGSWVSADGGVVLSCRNGEGDVDDPRSGAHYRAVRVADGRVLRNHRWGGAEDCSEKTLLSPAGDRFARGGFGKWEVLETSGDTGPRRFVGPSLQVGADRPFPLLGTAEGPVVPVLTDTTVSAEKLTTAEGHLAYGEPRLLGDGGTMLVRTGTDGGRLALVETEGGNRVVSEVSTEVRTPPSKEQLLAVNGSGTLVADVSDVSRVTVRRLPSLDVVSTFTAVRPAAKGKDDEENEPVVLDFQADDRLVTLSGTVIERWDTGTGRRLHPPIDLGDLRLTSRAEPVYGIGEHRAPGVIAVYVHGEPQLHAVDLESGRERRDELLTLGDDLLAVAFLKDRRYLSVLTTGRIVELWSAEPGEPARRVLGPLGPLEPGEFTVGNPAGADFVVAYGDTAVFLKADDPSYRDTYKFGGKQGFVATTDGASFLGTPTLERTALGFTRSALTLTRLDPAQWKRHICKVLGRGLTDDERNALPGPLPAAVCLP